MRPGNVLLSYAVDLFRTCLIATFVILVAPAAHANATCNLQIGLSCSGTASQASCVATTRSTDGDGESFAPSTTTGTQIKGMAGP